MRPETRETKDKKAMSELSEWAKALGLDVSDNGCALCLSRSGVPMTKAFPYRRPWEDDPYRSRAAAASGLIGYLSVDGRISFQGERRVPAAGGGVIWDFRTYEFKLPKCSSAGELAVKLAASGWRPPTDLFDDAVACSAPG